MVKYRGDSRQQWILDENRIVNRMCPDECFDIERASPHDEAHVISWPYKGAVNQHWHIDYV